jgi:hypothetical protein
MKKLSTLLIAISFCILSAGNVLANNPQVNRIDRHTVWTNWFDENGNRLPSTIEKMKSERESSQFAYTEKGEGQEYDSCMNEAGDSATVKFRCQDKRRIYSLGCDNQ